MNALAQLTALDVVALLLLALLGLIWLAASLASGGRSPTRASDGLTTDPVELALHPQSRYPGPGQPARALALLEAGTSTPESPSGDLPLLDTGSAAGPAAEFPGDPAALPAQALRRPALLPRPVPVETLAADLQPLVLVIAALIVLAALVLRILSLLLS